MAGHLVTARKIKHILCVCVFLKIEDFESGSFYIQTNAVLIVYIQYAQQVPLL